jgi:hypothetical protein|uniref:hypothetical protein n=1 Tax=Stappia sp. TaxID=1870903 RepID=UPI003BAA936C
MPGSHSVASAAVPADTRIQRIGFSATIILISALALFFGEIATMAFGVLWALQGFFALGPVATAILAALVAPLAVAACWYLTCTAIAGERALAPNRATQGFETDT